MPKHISQCNATGRLLSEDYLTGRKSNYVVTADEALIYLFDSNRKMPIYYRKIGEKDLTSSFRENKGIC